MIVIVGSLIGYVFVSDNMQPNLHKNVDLKIEQIWNHNIGIILLIIFWGDNNLWFIILYYFVY